ncbi:hypothetical protein FACS189434_05850 [Bacteroidia bacterium]|nr:hypothetical protein FACS189434_05850 [Bacteroidia bacterium]
MIMIMKKIVGLLALFVLIIHSVQAQYDAQFSQNMFMLSAHNPAMMSLDGRANVLGLNRQQWAGWKDGEPNGSSRPKTTTPATTVFEFAMPFTIGKVKNVGGILFFDDKAGLFANRSVYLQYAYKRNVWEGMLAGGVNLGFINASFDGSKAYIPESDYHVKEDPLVPQTDESAFKFDMALGLAYYDAKKYAGISVMHVSAPKMDIGEKWSMSINPLLNFTAGYNILLPNPLYEIKPSVFFKTDFISWQVDVNGIIEYKKLFFGGLSYRFQDAVVVMVGLKVLNGLQVSYSYDITTSKMGYSSVGGKGSHEILASYSFNIERTKRNKVKSVRIL